MNMFVTTDLNELPKRSVKHIMYSLCIPYMNFGVTDQRKKMSFYTRRVGKESVRLLTETLMSFDFHHKFVILHHILQVQIEMERPEHQFNIG